MIKVSTKVVNGIWLPQQLRFTSLTLLYQKSQPILQRQIKKSKDDLVENEDVLHTIYLVFLFITTIAGNLGKRLVDYASILPINNPEQIAFEPTLGFRIFVLILEIAFNLNAPYFSSSGYLYIINNDTSMELKRSVVLMKKQAA